MNDRTPSFFPVVALQNISRPLLQVFAVLFILASLWGITNQVTSWNQPVELVVGTPGSVQQDIRGGSARYWLPFVLQETGEEMTFWLRNNGQVLDYFLTTTPTDTVALRVWSDDRVVLEVHPLIYGVPPIRDRVPPSSVLWGTSILGLLLALVMLFPGTLDRAIYRFGRRSRRR